MLWLRSRAAGTVPAGLDRSTLRAHEGSPARGLASFGLPLASRPLGEIRLVGSRHSFHLSAPDLPSQRQMMTSYHCYTSNS